MKAKDGGSNSAGGTHVLTASYTDGGAAGVPPLTREAVAILHARITRAASFDEAKSATVMEVSTLKRQRRICVQLGAGGHLLFRQVNLAGISKVKCEIAASEENGGILELRAGRPDGPLVGKVEVPETGQWDNWEFVTIPVTDPGGARDLYVVGGAGTKRFNLNQFEFHSMKFSLIALLLPVSLAAAPKITGPAGGSDVPAVQMLVPGFAVRALPLELPAINSLRYRADDKLMALGYDGKVYILTDTDGDGLEDKSAIFYDPGRVSLSLAFALTPSNYKHGQGVFIARKGGLVLEVDTDHDDRADKEIIVADGWETPKRFPGGASDAIGVALDGEGNVYFGLGASNSQNGYLLENGVANYRITSERGTVQKVAADFSKREIVATGIRASVGLTFNAAGDLFATDQEGATWMPNGNPFDELIHLQPGTHHGFPPRHPKHLPKVIDEPSVFDYGPQHQSTCGLQFNEPVNGGPLFGPSWWRGDALVAGASRGKIYRTKLVKTPAGYVGQNQIIACLSWLTIDQCLSPKGDLLVATHSGPDDWGNGPNAVGKIFKITRVEPETPQPVLSYMAGPAELRVVFDRPLTPAIIGNMMKRVKLEEGWFVREGDSHESFFPGYRAVSMQQKAPRTAVPVLDVKPGDDRHSLVITTPERTQALVCGIEIEDWPRGATPLAGELPQKSLVAVAADFSGVSAEWVSRDGNTKWSGWLPHFDLQIARDLTAASVVHRELWELLKQPGELKLRGQIDLWNLLRPAVQPGERLDYSLPPEQVSLVFQGPDGTRIDSPSGLSNITARKATWLPVSVTVPTGGEAFTLQVTWTTPDDAKPRPFALRRILVPWAVPAKEPVQTGKPPELAGGDRAKGEQLFTAVCSSCHAINGAGGRSGPDLSNLVYRDFASVMNDISNPSATINPDHVASSLP